MNRRRHLRTPILSGIAIVALGIAWAGELPESVAKPLRQISLEVKDFGTAISGGYIQVDVFIGGEDEDDTNKDVHVGILVRPGASEDTLTVRVTTMERSKSNPRVKNARESKTFTCACNPRGVRLSASDYTESELKPLAEDILAAVKKKKKIIKGIP